MLKLNAKLYLNTKLNLIAKQFYLNAQSFDLNAKSFNLNAKSFHLNNKCFDLNVKLKTYTRVKRNSYTNPNLIRTGEETYKDLNHRVNYCKFSLSRDVEVNPGPAFANPGKTIHAPHGQGNVDIFGENAGQQCVAMSLCSLVYVYCNGSILDSSALVNIMSLGNELYSMLSRLSRQTYLLLTELPTMVTVEDTDYSLEFSESYTANLHFTSAMGESICHAS